MFVFVGSRELTCVDVALLQRVRLPLSRDKDVTEYNTHKAGQGYGVSFSWIGAQQGTGGIDQTNLFHRI